jgi:hypothetical protein
VPWTIRNAVVMDAFVPVATNASETLWSGHNPDATGAQVYPSEEYDDQFDQTLPALGLAGAKALRSAALVAEATAPAEEAIAEIPGAEALSPGIGADGKRVDIRFNLAAREAVEETPHVAYVEKVDASDNLRWSLGGSDVKAEEPPLGAPKPAAKPAQPASTATLPGAAATVGTAVAALQK